MTFAVYFQGRIVIANVSSISLTTFFLVVLYNVKSGSELDIAPENDIPNEEFFVEISHSTCQALGYSLYCVGISMFCWMSVMCFDLFWTFARTTIPRYGEDPIGRDLIQKGKGVRYFDIMSDGKRGYQTFFL